MKSKYIWITIIVVALIIGGIIFFVGNQNGWFQTSNKNNQYNVARTGSNNNAEEDVPKTETTIEEIEVSSFSTKIYTKDPDRQNNISIACSILNDTIVPKNSEFSFCNTVGKATSSKGYEKANVYQDGVVVEALGGGMCQVSTTLYNAILSTSGTEVTERHEHSNYVPYVADGKDAAVAYGSYDFKFKNNNDFDLKIKADNTEKNVNIKILKLEEHTRIISEK